MAEMTVKEIKQELDAQGIKYDNRARKDDLLKLLNEDAVVGSTKEQQPKQKSYEVVHRFKDLQDNNKIYRKGDKFNHVGKSRERIEELSSNKNKIGKVLIKEVE